MSIFNFNEYQPFLKAYISGLPKKGWGFPQKLSEHMGIHPSHVSQVLAGSRDFSMEQAIAVADFIGLGNLETDYFISLINVSRAGTVQAKTYYRKKAVELKKLSLNLSKRVNHDKILSEEEKSIFYSSFIYSSVRLFCSLDDGVTSEQIKDRFELSADRLREILDFLLRTGLIAQSGSKYKMGTQHTHVEKGSPHLGRHLLNWRVQSIGRVENLEDDELQFTSPVSLSRKDFDKLRELFVNSINESLKIVKASPAEDIACINLDLFWIRK